MPRLRQPLKRSPRLNTMPTWRRPFPSPANITHHLLLEVWPQHPRTLALLWIRPEGHLNIGEGRRDLQHLHLRRQYCLVFKDPIKSVTTVKSILFAATAATFAT
jgi:hypothetical protein